MVKNKFEIGRSKAPPLYFILYRTLIEIHVPVARKFLLEGDLW
jgi:hypothetical protein